MQDMLKRAAAEVACMDRFAFKPVDPARRHCGKLAAHAIHKMGRRAPLLSKCRATTMAGAYRYVRNAGFADLIELMDATGLERIAPASARPADIIALPVPDDDPFRASLSVALSNGRILGCNPASGLIEPMIPHLFVAAWRV